MTPTTDFSKAFESSTPVPNFWARIFNDKTLSDCNDLEKLLAGCEIIAAVDQVDLLLAA